MNPIITHFKPVFLCVFYNNIPSIFINWFVSLTQYYTGSQLYQWTLTSAWIITALLKRISKSQGRCSVLAKQWHHYATWPNFTTQSVNWWFTLYHVISFIGEISYMQHCMATFNVKIGLYQLHDPLWQKKPIKTLLILIQLLFNLTTLIITHMSFLLNARMAIIILYLTKYHQIKSNFATDIYTE